MVGIGVNQGSAPEQDNTCRSNHSKLDLRLDTHQPVSNFIGDKKKGKAEESLSQRSFKSCDTDVVSSETQSLCELPGASYHYKDDEACCSLFSEDVVSKWNHFPMLEINSRVQSTLHSSKALGHDQRSVVFSSRLKPRDVTFNAHIIKFTTEEHHLESGDLAATFAQEKEPLEFIKCVSPCLHDGTGTVSNIFSNGFKLHSTSIGNPSRGKEKREYIDSDYVLKTGLENIHHGLCNNSDYSSRRLCETEEDNDQIANGVKRSRINRRYEVERDITSDGLTLSSFGRDTDETLRNDLRTYRQPISKEFHGLTKFNVPESAQQTTGNVLNYSILDTKNKMKDSTANAMDDAIGEFNISSNMVGNKSITKIATELTRGKQAISDSTYLSKPRGTSFFEMLTVPRSHAKQHGYSHTFDTDNGTRFEMDNARSNKSSVRTDTMSIDSSMMPKSQQATVSSRLNKDHLFHNLTNSSSASAYLIKPVCPASEAKLPDAIENTKEMSSSIKETINLDQLRSQVKRPHASNFASTTESKWLKRLRPNISDSWGTKRLKVSDSQSTGQPHHPFAEVVKPNISSSSMMESLSEKILDKTKTLQNSLDSFPGASEKDIKTWIGRWCKKNPPTTQPQVVDDTSVIPGTVTSKPLREHYLGKQLPSIAALALMGKAMNNLRARGFQRKGSSVVWNTEGLL